MNTKAKNLIKNHVDSIVDLAKDKAVDTLLSIPDSEILEYAMECLKVNEKIAELEAKASSTSSKWVKFRNNFEIMLAKQTVRLAIPTIKREIKKLGDK